MSEQISGEGNVVGRVSGDGRTLLDAQGNVTGHTSADGRTHYDKDWNVVGHTDAAGRKHYDKDWSQVGSTSSDGKRHYDKSGGLSGRTSGSMAVGGLVSLLRRNASKAGRGGTSDAGVVWSIFAFVIILFATLIPIMLAFFASVFLGFFVAIATFYQLYLEKKRSEYFRGQGWLREGIPTGYFRKGLLAKLPGARKLREYESPRRVGLMLSIPSIVCGLFLFLGAAATQGQRQTSDWIASLVFGLALFSQGIFLIWAGIHFTSVAGTLQPAQSESPVPPPLPPPGA